MFLTSSPQIPIENTRDVLSSSQWELLTVKDYSTHIDLHASKEIICISNISRTWKLAKRTVTKQLRLDKVLQSLILFL